MRALGALLALAVLAAPAAGDATDRLTRFRELGLAHGADDAAPGAALFALVDAEILENLASGPPFSSPAFIRERLDALGAAWGGMSLRLAGPAAPPPGTVVAALELAGAPASGSLRFYGPAAGGPRLLASVTRAGRLDVHPWPARTAGAPRLAASWLGAGAPGVGHALWLEVWELRAGAASPVWQSATAFPDGLVATGFAVEGGRIAVRYPAVYSGFKPGCEAQTEQVEVYRASAAGAGIALESRRVSNPWHRELSVTVDRLFDALEVGDRRTLAGLVPDPRLRERLPAHLRADGACEQREEDGRAAVVAATETRGGALRPWSLRFVKSGAGWRLAAASPVLE